METATELPLTVLDKAMGYQDGQPYIPAEEPPTDPRPQVAPSDWKEANYKRFAERTTLCFPPPLPGSSPWSPCSCKWRSRLTPR